VPWVEIFIVFAVSHLVGDYILQTEFQATNKRGGLGPDPVKRRALFTHVLIYTLSFTPAFVWIGTEHSALTVALIVIGIFIPHAIQDDGRLLGIWMRTTKKTFDAPGTLAMMVDQSFHVVVLFTIAVIVGT
jgi:hypothetical protein